MREILKKVQVHVPFYLLREKLLPMVIRQATLDRLRQVFELIPWFRPRSVVCHPSFDEKYYISGEKLWLANSLETWRRLLEYVGETETVIALENVYEGGPHQLRLLLESLSSPKLRFCFDTGH